MDWRKKLSLLLAGLGISFIIGGFLIMLHLLFSYPILEIGVILPAFYSLFALVVIVYGLGKPVVR